MIRRLVLIMPFITLAAAADPLAGLRDRYTLLCGTCHGQDGKGQTKLGRRLGARDLTNAETQARLTDERIRQVILEGIPKKMPAHRSKFSAEEVPKLVAMVRAFGGAPEAQQRQGSVEAKDDVRQPTLIDTSGEHIYRKLCATCHGVNGLGETRIGAKLGVPDLTDPALQNRLKDPEVVRRIHEGTASGCAGKSGGAHELTDEQAQATVRHVRTLRTAKRMARARRVAPPPKRQGPTQLPVGAQFYLAHCATCHGKDGKSVTRMGKYLAAKDLSDPKVQAALTNDEIIKLVEQGIPRKMPSFSGRLSESELRELVAFVRGLVAQ